MDRGYVVTCLVAILRTKKELPVLELDKGYVVTYLIAVLHTKKELPVSEYMDKGYIVMSLIRHPYGDSLAPLT